MGQLMEFHHNRKKSTFNATIAVNIPSKEQLHNLFLSHQDTITLDVGLTVKSQLDQFEKKKGREAALKNSKKTTIKLQSVNLEEKDRHLYRFETEILHNRQLYDVYFTLTTIHQSDKVKLIDTYIQEHENDEDLFE